MLSITSHIQVVLSVFLSLKMLFSPAKCQTRIWHLAGLKTSISDNHKPLQLTPMVRFPNRTGTTRKLTMKGFITNPAEYAKSTV